MAANRFNVGDDFLNFLQDQPPQPGAETRLPRAIAPDEPNIPNLIAPGPSSDANLPPGQVSKEGNNQTPRERSQGVPTRTPNPDAPNQAPRPLTPPSPEATTNPTPSSVTPKMPSSPTPTDSEVPFTPLPSPAPPQMVNPTQFDELGKGSLLGKAGGLLEGGLGVPGKLGEENGQDSLLPLLLKILSSQGPNNG